MGHFSEVSSCSSSSSSSSSAPPPLPNCLEERIQEICLSKVQENQLSFKTIKVRQLNQYCRYNGESNLKGEPHGEGELRFTYPLLDLNKLSPPFGEKNNVIFIVYKGHFNKGEAHGEASISFENGPSKIFQGEFYRGHLVKEKRQMEDGSHRLIKIFHTSMAHSYIGDLDEKGKFQGKGWCIFQRGDFYVGSFKDSQFHGIGERVFSSGAYYLGPFFKDVRMTDPKHPIGWLRYENGVTYRGEFKDNVPLGKGEFAMPNQLIADPVSFSDDDCSLHSRCWQKETFFDPERPPFLFSYEGSFNHKNLPKGRGAYIFANGTSLRGSFEEASMTSIANIQAIKLLPSGEQRMGLFEEGRLKLNTPARLLWRSLTYKGFVDENEAPNGEGCILINDRVIYRGLFMHGMLVAQFSSENQSPLELPIDWREMEIPK